LDLQFLKSELLNEKLLRDLIYFEEIESTNSYAKIQNIPSDMVVLSSNQTGGFGRFSRKWESSPGNDLTFTIIKDFSLPADEIHLVNFYTSFVIHKVLSDIFKDKDEFHFSLKWPNDVLLNERKIGGILTDVQHLNQEKKKFIIGIGINVNGNNFSEILIHKASSLFLESGVKTELENLLIKIIKEYYTGIELVRRRTELMNKWKDCAGLTGKRIRFKLYDDQENEIEAVIKDIDSDGGLMLELEDGKFSKYYSGEMRIES